MRTVLFFFFKHGRLLPDEVCNVRLQLLNIERAQNSLPMLPSLDYADFHNCNNTTNQELHYKSI